MEPAHKKMADAVYQIVAGSRLFLYTGTKASEVHEKALSEFKHGAFEGMCWYSSAQRIVLPFGKNHF
jgi:hypothetical protein